MEIVCNPSSIGGIKHTAREVRRKLWSAISDDPVRMEETEDAMGEYIWLLNTPMVQPVEMLMPEQSTIGSRRRKRHLLEKTLSDLACVMGGVMQQSNEIRAQYMTGALKYGTLTVELPQSGGGKMELPMITCMHQWFALRKPDGEELLFDPIRKRLMKASWMATAISDEQSFSRVHRQCQGDYQSIVSFKLF